MNRQPNALPIMIASALVVTMGAQGSRTTVLSVPSRISAYPSIEALGQFVTVAWGAAPTNGPSDVYTAVSRDGGRTFGRSTRVNDIGTQASLSGEQPPRVSLVQRAGKDPSIVVVWTSKGAGGTRILTTQSDNGGMSFTRPTPVPGSDAAGNRGWETTATDGKGRVLTAWLDHRELASGSAGASSSSTAHQHGTPSATHTDGATRAQRSKFYFATLGHPESVRVVTGGVCYCCKTTLATGSNGAVFAAWRHVYPGNVRDIAFAMSRDGGQTFAQPIKVSADGWVLEGCPENGPSMVVDERDRIHLVWPTLVRDSEGAESLALFYATSADGRQFTPRRRVPTEGVPRHPQIALGRNGRLLITWDEQVKGHRQIAMARTESTDQGEMRFVRQAINDPTPGSYPVVAGVENGLILAWTSGVAGQTVIRTERFEK